MTEASGPTSAGLLAVAEAIDRPISGATLSHWRRRGLLPNVRRSRGGRSVFVHPVGTDQQLRRLLYWRERSDRLAFCAVALWVEGFLERLLGLRRGHGGGIADEFSLKEADGFGTRLRKPAARSIIIRATNVELEFARRLIGMTVEWLPRRAEAIRPSNRSTSRPSPRTG